jgi:hypothetical protein
MVLVMIVRGGLRVLPGKPKWKVQNSNQDSYSEQCHLSGFHLASSA